MFQIEFDALEFIQSLSRAPELIRAEFRQWSEDFAEWICEDLKSRMPRVTGKLAESTIANISGDNPIEVTFESGYQKDNGSFFFAKYLDEGTGKFGPEGRVIRVTGKPMVFEQHGQKWFHWALDGIKPMGFTDKTFMAAVAKSESELDKLADRIFKAVIG